MWRVGDRVWFTGGQENLAEYPAGEARITTDYGASGMHSFRYQIEVMVRSGRMRSFSAKESELLPLGADNVFPAYQVLTRPDGSTVRVTEDDNGKVVLV